MASIAVVSLTDPDGPAQGATLRVGSLCRALEAAGHQVHRVFPQSHDRAGLRPSPLRRLKRYLLPMPTALGGRDTGCERRLTGLGSLDGLVVTALSQASMCRLVPDVPVWVDFLDVWSDFAAVEATTRRGLARLTSRAQVRVLRRQEAELCRRAAVITAVGWQDARELQSRGARVRWLPTSLPDEAFEPVPVDTKRIIGFFADFGYWPNREAFFRLATDWRPELQARGWRVLVAGRSSSSLPAVEGIHVLGEVSSPGDFYRQVSATAAPIALGGGMKVKVVESLAYGRPVLASPAAIAGLPPEVARLTTPTQLDIPDVIALEGATLDLDTVAHALTPYRRAHLETSVIDCIQQLLNA